MGCMTIFNGIYLSQKLGRPVTKDEILADSMEQLVNPSPKAEPEEEAPIIVPAPKAAADAAPKAVADAAAKVAPEAPAAV